MNDAKTGQPARGPLVVYLLLAFGITWLLWVPTLLISGQRGYLLPVLAQLPQLFEAGFESAEHAWLALAFSLAVYGPLVGSLAATWMSSGRAGLVDLFRRMLKWRLAVKWYLVILVIAALLAAVPWLIAALAGQATFEWGGAGLTIGMIVFLFIFQVLTSGLGEEPGWRGYLLPVLQSRLAPGRCVWVLGFIWAVWHYPFVLVNTYANMIDVPPIGVLITLAMALLGQTLALIGITYLYVWIYNNTQSVFLAMIFHALTNLFPFLLAGAGSLVMAALSAIMPWIMVFFLERFLGKQRFLQVVQEGGQA